MKAIPTLFLPATGGPGIIVRRQGGRRTAKPRPFPSPAAALAWCLTHRTNLVLRQCEGPPVDWNCTRNAPRILWGAFLLEWCVESD